MRDNVSYGYYFTDVERMICKSQGLIFEEAANRGYDIISFTKAYMSSKFCAQYFDTLWSYYQSLDCKTNIDILLFEVESNVQKLSGDGVFAADIAFWIGYIYRQLYIGTGTNSAELCMIVPAEKLVLMYPGLHTISEDMAFEQICKDFNLQMKPEFNEVFQTLSET